MVFNGANCLDLWDLDDIRMRPIGRSGNRHLANLVFSGANCLDLWVDGESLRLNGKTTSVDEKLAINQLDDAVNTYYDGIE